MDKTLNVLHLIESLERGGAERRLVNDIKFINKDRFNNIVCYLFDRDDLKKELLGLNIAIHALHMKKFPDIGGFTRLLKLVKKHCVHIIHTQLFFADVLGRLIGKFLKIPVIVSTVQSTVYEPGNSYLYSSKREWIDKTTARLCNNRIIAVSDFAKHSAIKRLGVGEDKVEVIYNYVDIDELNHTDVSRVQGIRKDLDFGNHDMVLITVGRLDPPKGHRYLLEAMSEIVEDYPSVKLLVVGDGPSRAFLEHLCVELGMAGNVFFLGMRKDTKELLHASDVFVFPTLSEGLPLTLLEAAAVGKPCVASDIPPNREIIENGKTGLLVKPRDSRNLKELILYLVKNEDRRKYFGAAAKQFVEKKFNPFHLVHLLEELYLRTYHQAAQELQ